MFRMGLAVSVGLAIVTWALPAPASGDDVGAGAAGAVAVPAHKYAGATKCRSCHKKEEIGNQYELWEESKHGQAFKTLSTDQAEEWAEEAGIDDAQKDGKCLKCHVAGYGTPKAMLGLKYKHEEGVTCEACHGPGWDYRKKKVMIDRDLAIEKGLVPQEEGVCLTCHNDESPAWDPKRYTRPDGTTTGFDYEQAVKAIAHPVPEGYDPLAEGEAD